MKASTTAVGIDSCKRIGKYYGWAVFWINSEGSYGFQVYSAIQDIMADHCRADCVLIDIPVGLPETKQEDLARPDQELRSRLKGKTSSVFNTPCRQAVYCFDRQAAKAINQSIVQKSLSEQSLGFSAKIREVDLFLAAEPQYIGRIREAHPEYSFSILNGGIPQLSKKTERAGFEQRRQVLWRYFNRAPRALDEIMQQYPQAILDDFVDAMVLAVLGSIGLQNGFLTIPELPQKDSRGVPMEIVYSEAGAKMV